MELVTLGAAALELAPPGSERLETAQTLDVGVTGPECNAAAAAGRIGAEPVWLSRLPAGPLGARIDSELRGHGVEVVADTVTGRQGLTFFERGRTPRPDARVDDLGNAVVEGLTMDAIPTDRVEAADTAYVTAATPRASTGLAGATAKFLKTASDAGARTALGVLDIRGWSDLDSARETLEGLLPAVDVLVGTADAVEAVFDRGGEPSKVTHALASSHDLETVALCRASDASVWHDSTVHGFERPEVDSVDATGAVDAFAGAFLAGLDGGIKTALRRGIAADALVRTTPEALPTFSSDEVEAVAETLERT
ncbi:MAG: PfkB family carbohydrate kinase [Natronomonas sp.]